MRLLENLKLGIKLPLMLVAIAMIALTIMGASAYREAYGLLESEGKERLGRTLESRVSQLEAWSRQVESGTRQLAGNPTTARALYDFDKGLSRLGEEASTRLVELFEADPDGSQQIGEEIEGVLDYAIQHRRYHPGFRQALAEQGYDDLYLVARDGRVVYSVRKGDAFAHQIADASPDFSTTAQAALDEINTGVSSVIFSKILTNSGAPHLYAAMPVISANGLELGALVLRVPATEIGRVMGSARGLGETGQGYVTDEGGRLLGHLRNPVEGLGPGAVITNPVVAEVFSSGAGRVEGTSLGGHPAIEAFMPLELFGERYAAVVEQDRVELFAPAQALARSMLFHASWLVLLLAGLSAWMARSVSRPLQRLGIAIGAIAGGDHHSTVEGRTRGDEVGVIAKALDGLRHDLAAADEIQRDARLQGTAFNTASAALMLVDADFRIIHANAAVVTLIDSRIDEFRKVTPDLSADRLIGRCMDEFHAVPGTARRLLTDRDRLPLHVDIKVGDGRFGVDVSEIIDEHGGTLGLVVEWRDVTQLRMQRALIDSIDANQIVCETLPDGTVTRLNDRLRELLGSSAEGVLGAQIEEMLRPENDSDPWPEVHRGHPVSGRFILRTSQGAAYILEGTLNPVADRANRMMKIVLIANDVTQAVAALAAAQDENERMMAAQQSVVDALREGLSNLSQGDLSTTIETVFPPDYEALRTDFNAAVINLSGAMQAVIDNAAAIDTEAREISSASDDLSKRTEQQAATLEQTAAALDELSSSVSASAKGVSEADTVVSQARTSAENSGVVVKQAILAMSEIETSSQKISKIIGVIDEIAFQTNLLALNAGVEAARAGEAGRGFAVVASEVRALAQRSSDAAREIATLITASSEQVSRGVGLVGETGRALQGILSSVVDIAARVSEIASGAQEQAQGLNEINSAMNQLDQVTQQNAAMFEQTTAASHALNASATALRDTTSQFRVPMKETRRTDVETTRRNPQRNADESSPEERVTRGHEADTLQMRTQWNTDVEVAGNVLKVTDRHEEEWEDF
ncbi:methyl-accepting chemotaxis protein [Thioclava pacifica]|uniref:Methyl-accepting chemotaxis protein n=1 Tax=Thioclava pacifica DSM 10166 TaxID=1353537 RepID=A0A074J5E5_9RHOB|nr:hypothetical protein TP2_09735 [Thioclava pacifica DSM 10166]